MIGIVLAILNIPLILISFTGPGTTHHSARISLNVKLVSEAPECRMGPQHFLNTEMSRKIPTKHSLSYFLGRKKTGI